MHLSTARTWRERLVFMLFLLPALFFFVNVVLIPFAMGLYYSFTSWDGIRSETALWVGLENYERAFQDETFLDSFLRSFRYSFLQVLFVNLIGFGLALLVTSRLKSRNFLRSVYFLPNLIGGLILGFVWQFIFSKLFVQVGKVLGLENIFFNWLQDEQMAFYSLVIVSLWQTAGYTMVIYIAGLQTIPDELIEAASIDGASAWQVLRRIKLPLLIPTITINLFVTLSNALKQYDINLALTNGGPYGSTELVAMNIYQEAYRYNNFARAQAKAVLFFIVIFVITLAQLMLSRTKETRL